jgi:hypothetical protein
MQTTVQGNSTSNAALWGGGIMSGLVIAFMLLDGGTHNATDGEQKTFEAGRDSMRMGWTGTMEQLEAYLAKAQ